MKLAWDNLFVLTLIAACSFLIPLGVHAGDNRNTMPERLMSSQGFTSSGPRSSPYNPPTKDVFVTDSGPGLDTGCTFNDDPEHPLIIDVLVDRYVGEVDADGFLVNPQPLIDKGIIPARVSILMPAYDVDLDGESPPERDDVLFNGENLGSLIGFNSRWEYNSFVVDITKIKFPTKPAEGSLPTPVENRVQINVDVLGNSDWCTAIDWVALEIPIKPEFALTLAPKEGHNEIRVNDPNSEALIDTIYKQSFDADCNIREEIGAFDEFPFSGPAITSRFLGLIKVAGTVTLHTKIEYCSTTSNILQPDVKIEWQIMDTPLQGTENWTGFEGDVTIKMPDNIGFYTVRLTYIIDGSERIISRKLFVTKKAPLKKVSPPMRIWYENATSWATGETDREAILSKLLSSLYTFGQNNWHYAYCFGGTIENKHCIGTPSSPQWVCQWQGLVAEPLVCNYGDCNIFSHVFEMMAATLGIGSFLDFPVWGSNNQGFLTKQGISAFDQAFSGNARLMGSTIYNRYRFKNHNLRKSTGHSLYYDATFGKIYNFHLNQAELIAYNVNGDKIFDNAQGLFFYPTDEGARIYEIEDLRGNAYDHWKQYEYTLPPVSRVSQKHTENAAMDIQGIQFTGNVSFNLLDEDNDNLIEAVDADVEVKILKAGNYSIDGILRKNGQLIADQPAFNRAILSQATITESPGIYTISLRFSGEQIFQSGQNGPYELVLYTVSNATTLTVPTPAYDHTYFGEMGAFVRDITETAIDDNGEGKFEFIEVTTEVEIRKAGQYYLEGSLSKNGHFFIDDVGDTFTLTPGTHRLILRFPGQPLRRSGLDGPYNGGISIYNADRSNLGGLEFETQAYHSADFSTLLELDATFNDQGIDTNNNGLFDLLQIDFEANLIEAGTFRLKGELTDLKHSVYTDDLLTLSVGSNTLTLNFHGPLIHDMEMNGPFEVGVIVQNPDTFEILDFIRLPRTAAYAFTEFEPLGGPPPAISLTSTSFDEGIDIDGNRLFDELHVKVDLELTTTDFYEWSARLMDANGTRIDADYGSSLLDEGTASIEFLFDGNLIGQNGIDGPFEVQGLLIYGQTGPNLAYSGTIAETQAYRANQFEGFVAVDEKKVTLCHIPRKNPEAAHTITISKNALLAHLAHGDTEGPCPSEAKSKRK
ncbi:MAG: hypothetical protein DRR16_26960 [Candidatus Parabeggiatoa sp. nov. 3]|nr:MAG: hypothetical protein DRR00_28300 [Gammaproteobacteria bacterium]RKZ57765.1 MAG: hypothetical protein DRQ99_26435 [Gammaproteobacteria bacterium]RKZ78811.1 MAG: hypothetical protein DRR16_26960 [Gammaproteobacteria bacterium]